MFCEKCGKNHATTHIKTVVNGIAREYNLCAECAAHYGYATNTLAGMLASMFGDITQKDDFKNTKKCPVCDSTFSDIAKCGRVGCSECYNTFYDQLVPYLKRVHGSTKHIGKIPNNAPLVVKPKEQTVEDLRNELSRLVAQEEYELAAVIRDKIKEMEVQTNE